MWRDNTTLTLETVKVKGKETLRGMLGSEKE